MPDFAEVSAERVLCWAFNQETYDCMEAIRARYNISVEVYFPEAAKVQNMVRAHGLNLFYNSVEQRKLCCAVRKVEPLNRALKNLDAWMTGLRREQAVTRSNVSKVEFDKDHGGIVKINPLVDWRHQDVWNYIRENTCLQPAAQARLSEHRLRAMHASGETGRRSARRALVVGKSRYQRVRTALYARMPLRTTKTRFGEIERMTVMESISERRGSGARTRSAAFGALDLARAPRSQDAG